MSGWVQTFFPWWAEDEEEEADWSIADRKEPQEKRGFEHFCVHIPNYPLTEYQVVDAEPSKVIFISLEPIITSASK